MIPSVASSACSVMSRAYVRLADAVSPGYTKPGIVATWMLWARPMPVSSMPPHHIGTPRSTHRSWIRLVAASPPTRPTFTLTTVQAARSSAAFDASRRRQRLVEAQRCLHLRRERGVVDEVVPVQRLLDVVQAELVDLLEHVDVVERVRRVGIDGQLDVGELGAHRRQQVDIPARLDLQLDPLVALLDVPCRPRPRSRAPGSSPGWRRPGSRCARRRAESRSGTPSWRAWQSHTASSSADLAIGLPRHPFHESTSVIGSSQTVAEQRRNQRFTKQVQRAGDRSPRGTPAACP